MADYTVLYPRKISLVQGLIHLIRKDEVIKEGPLHIIVNRSVKEMSEVLKAEGFHRLVFCENRRMEQIGKGFTKMLNKGWEIHVRFLSINGLKDDGIAINGEIEISRKYIQHIFSARAAVLYEIVSILKRNSIDYKIWNVNINDYVSKIIDNHKIRLRGIPMLIPWVPSCIVGGSYGLFHLLRFLSLI
jgi:hypothetical protein